MNLFLDSLLKSLLPIGLFGVLGVFCRYFMGLGVNKLFPSAFPYGTFSINILGSFLIGVIFVAGVERAHIHPSLRLGIMIGFLGGFTTFSSYCLEAALLFERGKTFYALCYFLLSPMIGIIFTFLGITFARKLF